MDIKDVKVGDRCWVACGIEEEKDGTNATISSIDLACGLVYATMYDGMKWLWNLTPGREVFWRKPEAPPRPKRKVTKTGWANLYESAPDDPKDRYMGSVYDTEEHALNMRLTRCMATIKISWMEEE